MIKKGVTRRPLLWAIFAGLSLVCILFSIKYFSQALPITHIKLTMNREIALTQARLLCEKLKLGPRNAQQAASFETDAETQFFVELEAGGKAAFKNMIRDSLYEPYTWQVRHFHESEHNEVTVVFTPNGTPYGFRKTLAETVAGAHLSTKQAQKIAETFAQTWPLDLSCYKLIESSQETKPSTRIDHTFVYERTEQHIGAGRYRVKIVVSGDTVTELSPFVKIPDEFSLRYQEMRAANKTVASTAGILALFLYILCGGLIGLYMLSKSGSLVWKAPLICAGILGALQFAAHLNTLTSAWMSYDTALPVQQFILFFVLQGFISALGFFLLMLVTCATAEGLTRRAYGNQPQLWNMWSVHAANSPAVLGRTIAGYLLVGIQFALVIAVYLFANRFFHWWWPTDILIDPNIVATRFPWLSSVSNAVSAGVLEECLFRAIPLACAALLGNYFGKRSWWIAITFIIQALIFGGAHADYPAQPAYARLLEIMIPSFMFGGMYLGYGLLPAIITHSLYDLVLMSLPLFVMHAPGMFIHQSVVIFVALIPLFAVLIALIRTRKFSSLESSFYNAAWQPSGKALQKTSNDQFISEVQTQNIQPLSKKLLLALGIVGSMTWLVCTQFHQDAPRLSLTREQAIKRALRELAQKQIHVSDSWQPLTELSYDIETNTNYQFIWQTDKNLYKKLIGSYLTPPYWLVRFVRFDGTIAQRSEDYKFYITEQGSIVRYAHQLPESQPGKNLAQNDAQKLAYQFINAAGWASPETLTLISAQADKKNNRMDWLFTFSLPALNGGDARILVRVSGDEITDAARGLHIPEQWERDQRKQHNLMMLLKLISLLFLFVCLLFIIVKGKIATFSVPVALVAFTLLLPYMFWAIYNSWPALMGTLNTSEPVGHQLFTLLISLGARNIIKILAFACLFGLVFTHKKGQPFHALKNSILIGICLGLFVLGSTASLHALLPSPYPLWASYEALNFRFPFIGMVCAQTLTYIFLTALTLFVARSALKTIQLLRIHTAGILLLCGIVSMALAGVQTYQTLSFWVIAGVAGTFILMIVLYVLQRAEPLVLVPAVGTFMIGVMIQQAAFNAYPHAFGIHIIACVFIMITCYFLMRRTVSR